MLIGSLALMGFPFLSGFYSKDTILEIAYARYTNLGHFAYILGTLSVFSTAFYSCRLLYLVFLSEPNGFRKSIVTAHEPSLNMAIPLCLLSIFSIFIGFLSKDLFIGFGTSFWNNSLFILPAKHLSVDIEFISIGPKLIPLFLTLLGATLSFLLYSFYSKPFFLLKVSKSFKALYTFLNRRWYFDRIYNQFISQNVINSGFKFFYVTLDRGLLEKLGPLGIQSLIKISSSNIKKLHGGAIFHYVFMLLLLITLFITFMLYFFIFYQFLEVFLLLFILCFFL